ncbi:MAG: antitoxin [Anaerolineales bacterium]|nr:antitoxin [Anaerolineales bacterium]
MTLRQKALAQRIRLELVALAQTTTAIDRHWQRAKASGGDQDAFLNSVALNLHSFYNGLERTLELIALEMDGGTLGGETWHIELLRQMTMELPPVRPAVLSVEASQNLDEYRKFRHRVRNIYAIQLIPARMEYLVENLPSTWLQIRIELSAFADFLDGLENHE